MPVHRGGMGKEGDGAMGQGAGSAAQAWGELRGPRVNFGTS